MFILFPGRHHLLTSFQYKYLFKILNSNAPIPSINGDIVEINEPIEGIVFAVTSANHSGTKRNPIPFHLRAMLIQDFCNDLGVKSYVYGIDEVGQLDDFAGYTLKTILHDSNHDLELHPDNTLLLCSTPVMDMYIDKGFKILPAELKDKQSQTFSAPLPWDYVEKIATSKEWKSNLEVIDGIHSSSYRIWNTYNLGNKVNLILNDPIIGDDGDITESRDYNTYVRQMDEIAELKFQDTAPFIKAGNIGDIGCAVGSWIKYACIDERLRESDFYGIEVARLLYDICHQRKHNGEFENPSVFFAMKNAVTDLVFEKNSMNTIHTSSLTHEIESYGSRKDLSAFIQNRYAELKSGGVWINRDVVGPENGNEETYMWLNDKDGENADPFKNFDSQEGLSSYLDKLSTYSKFLRFAKDFRAEEEYELKYELIENKNMVKLKLKDAADFMLTKDYTDNWKSEMHETFCFWSFNDWKKALEEVGFRLRTESKAYQNPWIAENRWFGKVELFSDFDGKNKLENPPTNMLMVAEKVL